MIRPPSRALQKHRQSGLTYVEVMIAALVIATTVGAAGTALQSAAERANQGVEATIAHFHLAALAETVLAEPFTNLEAAALGQPLQLAIQTPWGLSRRRLVYINQYDGDNADGDSDVTTGTDPDLLWIRVDIDGSAAFVEALRVRD